MDGMHSWTARMGRSLAMAAAGLALFAGALATTPAAAQVRTVDPDKAIDGDLVPLQQQSAPGATTAAPMASAPVTQADPPFRTVAAQASAEHAAAQAASNPVQAGQQGATYKQDDLIGAAEGVFGKGAHGLADLIKDRDNQYLMIDSTLVRAHQQAATGKGGPRIRLWGAPEAD